MSSFGLRKLREASSSISRRLITVFCLRSSTRRARASVSESFQSNTISAGGGSLDGRISRLSLIGKPNRPAQAALGHVNSAVVLAGGAAAHAERAAERVFDLGLQQVILLARAGLGLAIRTDSHFQLLRRIAPHLERGIAGGDSGIQVVIGVIQLPIRPLQVEQVSSHRPFQIGQGNVGVGPRDQHAVEHARRSAPGRRSGCIRFPPLAAAAG